jgi:hypothetical protein
MRLRIEESKMVSPHYVLQITNDGPFNAPFGWQIIDQKEWVEIARSATTFARRMEALTDSTRVAAFMALDEAFDCGRLTCSKGSRDAVRSAPRSRHFRLRGSHKSRHQYRVNLRDR